MTLAIHFGIPVDALIGYELHVLDVVARHYPGDVTVWRDRDSWEQWHEPIRPGEPYEHITIDLEDDHSEPLDVRLGWLEQAARDVIARIPGVASTVVVSDQDGHHIQHAAWSFDGAAA